MTTDILLFVLILLVALRDHYRASFSDETTRIRLQGINDDLNARARNRQMLHERLNHHNDRLEELEKERKLQLDLAGGGVWRTQSGYTLRIRDMSTNHLQNTLNMFHSKKSQEPFLSMQRELKRREEDAEWQRKTAAREAAIAECAMDIRQEDARVEANILVQQRLDSFREQLNKWLTSRAGRGISIGTMRRKITELLK